MNLTAVRDPEQIVTRHFGESLFAARRLFPGTVRVGTGASPIPAVPDLSVIEQDRGRAAFQGCATGQEKTRPSPPEAMAIADIGSGAGFPGVPIKIWAPQVSLTLVESNHKKTAFLHEVVRALTLMNVDIRSVRAEALPQSSFAVVTVRAVERFQSILPTAAGLVVPGGRLALLIGSSQFDSARSALPHLAWEDPKPVPLSRARVIAVGHRTRSEPR